MKRKQELSTTKHYLILLYWCIKSDTYSINNMLTNSRHILKKMYFYISDVMHTYPPNKKTIVCANDRIYVKNRTFIIMSK